MKDAAHIVNSLPPAAATDALSRCCTCGRWVAEMLANRPFKDTQHLLKTASDVWFSLDKEDWLQAFAGHPRIGETAGARHAATSAWAQAEQAGVKSAEDKVKEELAHWNQEYDKRFGYIYIVCATGKSADEMLALLKSRMKNTPEAELKVAAGEQDKITRLRLEKLAV